MKKLVKTIPVDFLDDRTQTITLTWKRNNSKEVEIVQRRFTEYLEKGWIAFVVTPEGKKIQVHGFDPKLEKIILAHAVEGG